MLLGVCVCELSFCSIAFPSSPGFGNVVLGRTLRSCSLRGAAPNRPRSALGCDANGIPLGKHRPAVLRLAAFSIVHSREFVCAIVRLLEFIAPRPCAEIVSETQGRGTTVRVAGAVEPGCIERRVIKIDGCNLAIGRNKANSGEVTVCENRKMGKKRNRQININYCAIKILFMISVLLSAARGT